MNEIALGWSRAVDLVHATTREAIAESLRQQNPEYYSNSYRLGRAVSSLHLFLNQAKKGDLVVVPEAGVFHVGEFVDNETRFDHEHIQHDTAHRRRVTWIQRDVPRDRAGRKLVSRMKARQTVLNISDLSTEVEEAMKRPRDLGADEIFAQETRKDLRNVLHRQIQHGRIDADAFERLVGRLLEAMGWTNVQIIAKRNDVGVDIEAEREVFPDVKVRLGVQVKHHNQHSSTSPHAVQQVLHALSAGENRAFEVGLVVTSGTLSKEARTTLEDPPIPIRGIDGDELVDLMLEYGVV